MAIDFLKDVADEEVLPIEKDQILQDLTQIPDDLIKGQLIGMRSHLDNFLAYQSVLENIDNPRLARHCLDLFTPAQFSSFKNLVAVMRANALELNIVELVYATLSKAPPSEESILKAKDLLKIAQEFEDVDLNFLVTKCNSLNSLINILSTYRIPEARANLQDRLSATPLEELDAILCIANSIKIMDVN